MWINRQGVHYTSDIGLAALNIHSVSIDVCCLIPKYVHQIVLIRFGKSYVNFFFEKWWRASWYKVDIGGGVSGVFLLNPGWRSTKK